MTDLEPLYVIIHRNLPQLFIICLNVHLEHHVPHIYLMSLLSFCIPWCTLWCNYCCLLNKNSTPHYFTSTLCDILNELLLMHKKSTPSSLLKYDKLFIRSVIIFCSYWFSINGSFYYFTMKWFFSFFFGFYSM